jgi:murein DD-endopeptidase MepM/ murein hydrolase activator NlpD
MKKTSVLLVMALLLLQAVFAATNEDSVWPLSNSTSPDTINDVFAPRLLEGVYDYHKGIDFPAVRGTPVLAVMDGTIVRMETAEENYGTARERFGNWMFVNHSAWPGTSETRMTAYMHMEGFAGTAYVGKPVTKGEVIGYVGDSGVGINTVHLHLDLHRNVIGTSYSNTKTKNPMRVLPYTDQNIATMAISDQPAGSYKIKVSLPAGSKELDLNRMEIYGTTANRVVDFETREGIDPVNNDNPAYNGVTISPDDFWNDHASWNMSYETTSAVIGTLLYATAYDIFGNVLANVTYTPPSAPVELFADNFTSLSQWTESNEFDWNVEVPAEKQPNSHPSGNTVAHADACTSTSGCILTMTSPVDLSNASSATVKFWRYVDNDLDKNEFLKVEAYNGAWSQIYYWTQGSGDDDKWHLESWSVPSQYLTANFKLRFTSKESATSEDTEVDDVSIVAVV